MIDSLSELAQNAPEDLVLELFQSQGILLSGNQSAPVISKEFLLTEPIGVVKSENDVVRVGSGGQRVNADEPHTPRPEVG